MVSLATHVRTRLLAACLVIVAGCGDDPAGPGQATIPDIVGTYSGTWQTRVTAVATGAELLVLCPGSVIIAEQEADGGFTGFWTQIGTTECTAAAGSLTGDVAAGGALTIPEFANASGQTLEESSGCTSVTGDDAYTGTADGTRFDISRTVTADCRGTELTIAWKLSAAR